MEASNDELRELKAKVADLNSAIAKSRQTQRQQQQNAWRANGAAELIMRELLLLEAELIRMPLDIEQLQQQADAVCTDEQAAQQWMHQQGEQLQDSKNSVKMKLEQELSELIERKANTEVEGRRHQQNDQEALSKVRAELSHSRQQLVEQQMKRQQAEAELRGIESGIKTTRLTAQHTEDLLWRHELAALEATYEQLSEQATFLQAQLQTSHESQLKAETEVARMQVRIEAKAKKPGSRGSVIGTPGQSSGAHLTAPRSADSSADREPFGGPRPRSRAAPKSAGAERGGLPLSDHNLPSSSRRIPSRHGELSK